MTYPANRKKRWYPPLKERLESNAIPVPFSGCLIWLGFTNEKGYGRMSFNRKLLSTHRLSWEAHNGPIPDGLQVLHQCDIPSCINPGHLFLGTNATNVEDKVRKGRTKRLSGESNPNARLSADDVATIRSSSMPNSELARIYGVDHKHIYHIRRRRTWKSQ